MSWSSDILMDASRKTSMAWLSPGIFGIAA
jgi:hypothetical protein